MELISKSEPTVFKVLLLGPSGVGKTSLLLKYIKNIFSYDYQVTIGVQFYTKNVQINQRTSIKLQIWDTVGQQAFRAVVRSFYKGVSAVVLMYSIDKFQTFQQLSDWMKQIRQYCHPQTMIFLVGGKLDLNDIRKVPQENGLNYLKSINGTSFIEVSAKTGQNIKQFFQKLSKSLYKKFNDSYAFKNLVQPISTQDTPSKAQSFHLKYSAIQKNNIKKQSECC